MQKIYGHDALTVLVERQRNSCTEVRYTYISTEEKDIHKKEMEKWEETKIVWIRQNLRKLMILGPGTLIMIYTYKLWHQQTRFLILINSIYFSFNRRSWYFFSTRKFQVKKKSICELNLINNTTHVHLHHSTLLCILSDMHQA